MKKAGNELLQFLAGLAMLIAGLFVFSQKVMVTSGFFGYGFRIGGIHMGNGLIMVPFIIGVVWMFVTEGNIASKLFTAASILVVILAVIMTTDIRLMHVTLYEWALILVLIFGGAGLVARILLPADMLLCRKKTERLSGLRRLTGRYRRLRKNWNASKRKGNHYV